MARSNHRSRPVRTAPNDARSRRAFYNGGGRKHTWTLQQRTVIYYLLSPEQFHIQPSDAIDIFNHVFNGHLTNGPFTAHQIRDDFHSRNNTKRSTMYARRILKAYGQFDREEILARQWAMQAIEGAFLALDVDYGSLPLIHGPPTDGRGAQSSALAPGPPPAPGPAPASAPAPAATGRSKKPQYRVTKRKSTRATRRTRLPTPSDDSSDDDDDDNDNDDDEQEDQPRSSSSETDESSSSSSSDDESDSPRESRTTPASRVTQTPAAEFRASRVMLNGALLPLGWQPAPMNWIDAERRRDIAEEDLQRRVNLRDGVHTRRTVRGFGQPLGSLSPVLSIDFDGQSMPPSERTASLLSNNSSDSDSDSDEHDSGGSGNGGDSNEESDAQGSDESHYNSDSVHESDAEGSDEPCDEVEPHDDLPTQAQSGSLDSLDDGEATHDASLIPTAHDGQTSATATADHTATERLAMTTDSDHFERTAYASRPLTYPGFTANAPIITANQNTVGWTVSMVPMSRFPNSGSFAPGRSMHQAAAVIDPQLSTVLRVLETMPRDFALYFLQVAFPHTTNEAIIALRDQAHGSFQGTWATLSAIAPSMFPLRDAFTHRDFPLSPDYVPRMRMFHSRSFRLSHQGLLLPELAFEISPNNPLFKRGGVVSRVSLEGFPEYIEDVLSCNESFCRECNSSASFNPADDLNDRPLVHAFAVDWASAVDQNGRILNLIHQPYGPPLRSYLPRERHEGEVKFMDDVFRVVWVCRAFDCNICRAHTGNMD